MEAINIHDKSAEAAGAIKSGDRFVPWQQGVQKPWLGRGKETIATSP
jgi:hypothetical protein